LHNMPDEGGILIHPTAGSLRCFVHGKYHVKEAPVAEGGVARFDITFIRAQPRNANAAYGSVASAVSSEYACIRAADELAAVAVDDFAGNYGNSPLEGLPSWAREAVEARLTAVTDVSWQAVSANGLRDSVDFGEASLAYSALSLDPAALLGNPALLGANMAALYAAPTNWVDEALLLADTAQTAADTALGNVHALQREGQRAQAWFDGMAGVWNLSTQLPPSDLMTQSITPTSLGSGGFNLYMYGRGDAVPPSPKQVRVNQLTGALDTLVETLATCQALRAATQIPLANIDQAFALRHAVHTQMLRLVNQASGTSSATGSSSQGRLATIDALRRAHTASLADLQARSVDLARLTSYTPQTWQPVVYISHRVYGTAAYADEIMAMNSQIRNPLLCAPGVALKLIRHD
jgi:hypothetical protein